LKDRCRDDLWRQIQTDLFAPTCDIPSLNTGPSLAVNRVFTAFAALGLKTGPPPFLDGDTRT